MIVHINVQKRYRFLLLESKLWEFTKIQIREPLL